MTAHTDDLDPVAIDDTPRRTHAPADAKARDIAKARDGIWSRYGGAYMDTIDPPRTQIDSDMQHQIDRKQSNRRTRYAAKRVLHALINGALRFWQAADIVKARKR